MKSLFRLFWLFLNPNSGAGAMASSIRPAPDERDQEAPAGARGGIRLRDVLLNAPLLVGSLIVLGLFLMVLFGPLWAPMNPYIAGGNILPYYDANLGEWISPPLPPSEAYPLGTDQWGNDILSMLLYGARNTLVACAFITMVRVIIGLLLGAIAGWNEGALADLIIMGAVGVIASAPMLISSMILIYALDIRRGLPVFIIALSAIGWTEITQYIRSEFLVLKKMPFIDGAHAVGTRGFAIAVRHILPNLLPQLLVISFLELGAVLMLLGELSFVGVFIGGGSRIFIGDEIAGQVYTLSEVPEWGAMLAEGYRWLRAKPFIVYPPALAFFIAVLGFNALGEGLRQLIERYHVNTNFLLRKRMLLGIMGLSFATVFIINNTGPAPWFAQVAQSFDGASAYRYTQKISEIEARGPGESGSVEAAEFIRQQFQDFGVQPGWNHSEYIIPLEVTMVEPARQPVLSLIGGDGNILKGFRHQVDFGFRIEGHGGSGDVQLPLTFVGFDATHRGYSWESYKGLDLRDRIVLLIDGNAPQDFPEEALIRGAKGVIWIVDERPSQIRSQNQLAYTDRAYLDRPNIPIFRILPSVASEILSHAGMTLEDLFLAQKPGQQGPGWFTQPLEIEMRMSLELSPPKTVEAPVVIGFIPGSDYDLAWEIVALSANFDGLGLEPDGIDFEAANHNASGTAVMLEIARLWQQEDLNPRRSVLFVAWGGGHLENSMLEDYFASQKYFEHLPNLSAGRRISPRVIFHLDGAGAGGEALLVHPGTSSQLRKLLESAAGKTGVQLSEMSLRRASTLPQVRAQNAQWAALSWEEDDISPDQDRFEKIEKEKLQKFGEILSLTLTEIVRETSY